MGYGSEGPSDESDSRDGDNVELTKHRNYWIVKNSCACVVLRLLGLDCLCCCVDLVKACKVAVTNSAH